MSEGIFLTSRQQALFRTVFGLLLLVASTAAVRAAAIHNVGWVWANQPDATSAYTPDTTYSYNSAGGAITITPLSTGVYEVDFASLHASGGTDDVQVSAYDTSGYCTSDGWGTSGTDVIAYAACFDANGNAADSYFTLLYQERSKTSGGATQGIAFLWADQPTTASYTPDTLYQYNSRGTTNTITRNGTGNYTVDIPLLDFDQSDVQVTAYGSGAARCKVEEWFSNDNAGTFIDVLCFNSAGQAADEYFDLAYAAKDAFGLTTTSLSKAAWAWANNDTSTTVYTPSTSYQWSDFGTGKLKAQETSTGNYIVTVPGNPSYISSTVLITAYGSNSDYCNVVFWSPVNVACYSQGGVSDNSEFDATFQTAQ